MSKSDYLALAGRTQGYALHVKRLFDEAVKELLEIAKNAKKGEVFGFGKTSAMADKTQRALRKLHAAVTTAIERGITLEWGRADEAADALVASVFGKKALKDNRYSTMLLRNDSALRSFMRRADNGMNLSKRVWNTCESLRKEMELAITVSVGEGVSADTISRRVRQYLNEPNKLFRRVRKGTDADGNPVYGLSKAAAAYHPGRGVYRSSYKNAMRLARTETNMAYRNEDCNRIGKLDFVLGIRINLSNNHPDDDICDELAGDYPKEFRFTGWHPQCRCYMTSILPTREELKEYDRALLKGEKYDFKGRVKDYPPQFKQWVKDHEEKIGSSENLPYFITDNRVAVDKILGIDTPAAPAAPTQFKYEKINDPHLRYEASQKGMSKRERLENLLNGVEGVYGSGKPVVRIIRSWDFSNPDNVKRALDVLKTNGWSDKEDLEVYKTISHLNELRTADFSSVPRQWQNILNDIIKKINAYDMTQGCLGVYPEIEHAYNIYKLSTTKEALDFGLNNLSDKTPYAILTTIRKKIEGFPVPPKEFFDQFERFVPLVTEGKSAFYNPKYKHVCVSMDKNFVERLSTSKWFQTGLVFHEYGHALDYQKGLRSDADLVKMYDDWKANVLKDNGKAIEDAIKAILDPERKKFYEWWQESDERKALKDAMSEAIKARDFSLYNKLDKEYEKLRGMLYRERLGELEEQLGALSDCIQAALDGRREIAPMGHPGSYFSRRENQLTEFIAHCFENYWNGNQYFRQIDPTLYELMSEWVNGLQ